MTLKAMIRVKVTGERSVIDEDCGTADSSEVKLRKMENHKGLLIKVRSDVRWEM